MSHARERSRDLTRHGRRRNPRGQNRPPVLPEPGASARPGSPLRSGDGGGAWVRPATPPARDGPAALVQHPPSGHGDHAAAGTALALSALSPALPASRRERRARVGPDRAPLCAAEVFSDRALRSLGRPGLQPQMRRPDRERGRRAPAWLRAAGRRVPKRNVGSMDRRRLLPERPAIRGVRAPHDPAALVDSGPALSRVDLAADAERGRRRRAPAAAHRLVERDRRFPVGRRRLRLFPGTARALARRCAANAFAALDGRLFDWRQGRGDAAVDRHDARARDPARRALARPSSPRSGSNGPGGSSGRPRSGRR